VNASKGVNCSYRGTCLKFAVACLVTVFFSDTGYAATNLLVGALRQDVVLEFSSTDDIIFTENTFAGISNPETMVLDPSGNLFVFNGKGNEIKKITPLGVKTTLATDLDVDGMAVDAFGNLFVSRKSENTNASDGVILKFTPDGRSSVFVSNISHPKGLAFDSLGNLYLAYPDRDSILKFTPDGRRTTFASGIAHPNRLAFDAFEFLWVTDPLAGALYAISPSGVVFLVDSSDLDPELTGLNDLAFDGAGNLFLTAGESVVEIGSTITTPFTVAAVPGGAGGIAIEPPTTTNLSTRVSVQGTALIADLNGDGHPDFVVRNPATRQTAIWHLNNNVLISGVLGPTLPAGWGLRGAADFNSDSHPDYGLFNSATRQTAIWDLSGPMFTGGALGPSPPSGWALVATADFNADGKPDYVLYNAATRQTAIWYLNNNVFVSGVFGPTLPAGWGLSGVADFNGDGHPDYALFNSTTRQTAIWYLSGSTFISGALGPTPPSGWALVATADVNGDGKPDYLLYNAATRQTAIWYLNDNAFVSGVFGPTLPAGWSLVGP
jgi:sugar lactone lactonase YvrE